MADYWNVTNRKKLKYNKTPVIRYNWDDEPSGYAESTDNYIFLFKYYEVRLLLFTVRTGF